jgi:adenine-specific DNA glycosylase
MNCVDGNCNKVLVRMFHVDTSQVKMPKTEIIVHSIDFVNVKLYFRGEIYVGKVP